MLSNRLHIPEVKKRPIVIGKTTFCSAYDFTLEEQNLTKSQQELKEEEHKNVEYLRKFKEKLAEVKQLDFRTDDDFLLRYLRYKKFNLDETYKTICRFYSVRKQYPEYFTLMPCLKSLLNTGIIKYLPYREEGGSPIMIMDIKKFNLEEMSCREAMQMLTLACDISTMDPHMQINAVIGVWDFRGLSVRHMMQVLQPRICLPLASLLQDIYPWRVKYILLIHCNKLSRALYSAAKPLLKKKVKERVHLLGSDTSEMHKFVNPAILPKEYGGTFEETDCKIDDIVFDNLPYLQYERSFGYKSE